MPLRTSNGMLRTRRMGGCFRPRVLQGCSDKVFVVTFSFSSIVPGPKWYAGGAQSPGGECQKTSYRLMEFKDTK